ncbi:LOW QUALITY PROTEIN: Pentatricopeptide repeat [Dillenia turbinata]|uniref:Pentatricopeptide repeat n=1 Tax=Dillenia turbinata TaxID=194707 RepID=A0AAN8W482_9MAGN
MNVKCGNVVDHAFVAFQAIPSKDVSWNAIKAGFAENGFADEAFKLKRPSYLCFSRSNDCLLLWERDALLCSVTDDLVGNVSVFNALVGFYLRTGHMEDREKLVQQVASSILGLMECNYCWIFLNRIDSVTLVSVLPACAHLQKMWLGKQIHGYIFRHLNLYSNTKVANAVLSFYAKCNDIDAAFHTFSMISRRDLISWNAMLAAFDELGSEARITTGLSYNINFFMVMVIQLLRMQYFDGYAKCGNMEYVFKIFGSLSWKKNWMMILIMMHMSKKKLVETNLTIWNLMIRAFAENRYPVQALDMVHKLQVVRMKADFMTVMSILPVCAQIATLHLLKQCHVYVVRSRFEIVQLMVALCFLKMRKHKRCLQAFPINPRKGCLIFTAMVGGYATHGMGEALKKVFYHMLESGIKLDNVLITTVLSACGHTGLVDEGWEIFFSPDRVHGMKPTMEQYACMVDLLPWEGRIEEAYSFASAMPNEGNANAWRTLLGTSKTHHHVELEHIVADRLFEIEDSDIGNYVALSKMHAADARWDRVMEIRRLMKLKDLKKPGCSWMEVEKRRNMFVAGELSYLQQGAIYNMSRI